MQSNLISMRARLFYGLIVQVVLLTALLLLLSACSGAGSHTATVSSVLESARAMQTPDDADAITFELLRNELINRLSERFGDTGAKITAKAPADDNGQVTDLAYNSGTDTLTWTYLNTGDYDIDGEVGVPDITPIALNYLADASNAGTIEAWIDGSGDGEVGIPDITPIAQNYLCAVAGYRVVTSDTETGSYTPIGSTVPFGNTSDFPKTFSCTLPGGALTYVAVQPVDSEGNPGIRSLPVELASPPTVINVTPSAGKTGTQVQFSLTALGTLPFTYAWDFGGGATPDTYTEACPTVTLSASGTYDASVTLTNGLGNDTFDFTLNVTDTDDPPYIAGVTPLVGEVNDSRRMGAFVTGTHPLNYAWNFGEGAAPSTSTEPNPNVILSDTYGNYPASLTVTNYYGSDTYDFNIVIGAIPEITAVTPLDTQTGAGETFSAAVTGSPPLTYSWDFGGGATPDTSTDETPTVTITDTEGDYDARVAVTNSFGSDTFFFTLSVTAAPVTNYVVVDTNQTSCYNESVEAPPLLPGMDFYGQDAQYDGVQPVYQDNGDGTVTDMNTGLMWQNTPDTNGDGTINIDDKLTWDELQTFPDTVNAEMYAGYDDWRLPTIKELYSLIEFSGTDPSGYEGTDTSGLIPFIDTDYFDFAYGDTDAGERIIDSQYASNTLYVSTVPQTLLFGVNFADGRIKGYSLTMMGGGDKTFLVLLVRGPAGYGVNDFMDNGDGTVSDNATGLMWQMADNGEGVIWKDGLAYAETLDYAGYTDWRLPNAKEMQSIIDYTRSPSTTGLAAIDPIFRCTSITNEAGQTDYPYYWTGTTHLNWTATPGNAAVYISFGRAMGYMNSNWVDVHGAGAQRSDPKNGDPADFPYGRGPQGDAIHIFNYVRCVRDM